jgi:hypothetical protein
MPMMSMGSMSCILWGVKISLCGHSARQKLRKLKAFKGFENQPAIDVSAMARKNLSKKSHEIAESSACPSRKVRCAEVFEFATGFAKVHCDIMKVGKIPGVAFSKGGACV